MMILPQYSPPVPWTVLVMIALLVMPWLTLSAILTSPIDPA
jgi:hypothetical protein